MPIRNPIEWLFSAPPQAADEIGSARATEYWPVATADPPKIRQITAGDLGAALRLGLEDFKAGRTDVVTLAVIFPLAGLFLTALAASAHLLPMIFPLVAGFALVGPLASIWFYELSRRREAGEDPGVIDAIRVVHSPQIGSIAGMGLVQIALFLLWLAAAAEIYALTLGPAEPASLASFVTAMLTTPAGWAMIVIGFAVGFVFAVIALGIGAMSFPLLLDRPVSVAVALATSVRALRQNPVTFLIWGLIVVAGLAIGALPGLLGIAVTLPILGHSTWHLYRRTIY